jgi:ornithine--oxo-acid transaminase
MTTPLKEETNMTSLLARNYAPLPVTLTSGAGVWVKDVAGRTYLDCLAAYSAVNFGHCHPDLVAAAHRQLDRLTLTSRAFDNDQLEPFARELTDLTGTQMMLPMNTGAEAVESAVKLARAWAERVKGVGENQSNIVVMDNNFHGRTTTIVSFSSDPLARRNFGPFTPGFRSVPFGDRAALAAALDENTAAILLEPVQGEAGVIIPPEGYLAEARALATAAGALLVIDEIQAGLGRTGAVLESGRQGVTADLICLGKALGGGIMPTSAVVGRAEVLGVLRPGEHGSTFGGNPLAAAVGRAVVGLLRDGWPQAAARERGAQLRAGLDQLGGLGVDAVRSVGLWAGLDVDPALGTAREICLRLADEGVLAKDTRQQTIRLAPPLVISPDQVEQLLAALRRALRAQAS